MLTPVTTATSNWLRQLQPRPQAFSSAVFFPHAGGSAPFFFGMSAALGPTIDVFALQYPGRLDRFREPAITDLRTLADETFAALRTSKVLANDQPFQFFGHSLGAVLAFEVALRCERELGRTPATLFASGRRAPGTARRDGEDVHTRGDAGLMVEIRQLNGSDSPLTDPALLELVLPSLRADYTAIETYRWTAGPTLRCPIVALMGTEDPYTSEAECQAWGEHTTGEFELRSYPGGHFFLSSRQDAIAKMLIERAR